MKPQLIIFGIGTVVIALVVFLNNRNVPDQHVFAQNASASRDDVATPTPNQIITQRPVEEPTVSPSPSPMATVNSGHRSKRHDGEHDQNDTDDRTGAPMPVSVTPR